MVCHTVRIPYKQLGDVIKIKPLADFHVGSRHCDEKAAKQFINEDSDCYFVGLGDLMDMVVPQDSKRYRKSSDATEGDGVIDEQIDKLYSWLEPHKSRILGLGTGNHCDEITKRHGTNPMARLCKMLNVPFLGYSWLLRLRCGIGERFERVRTVVIRGHHGWGGGSRTQGADLTKYARDISYWDADVFCYGHVHKKQSDRISRLGMAGEKLISKPKLLVVCGTFLKTFGPNEDPTYSEVKGYPPTEIGGVTINIRPTGDWVRYWVDM